MYLSSGEELEIPLMVVTSYMTQNPKGTNAKRERDTRFMEHLQPTQCSGTVTSFYCFTVNNRITFKNLLVTVNNRITLCSQ